MTAFDITPLQIPVGAPGHEMMMPKMPCKLIRILLAFYKNQK